MLRKTLLALAGLSLTYSLGLPPAFGELKDKETLNLYPGPAPGAQGETPEDVPAVEVYLPAGHGGADKAGGASVVVCPGGGYGMRANHEGPFVGEWFARNGVTAFVLRYRLGPKYHHPVELSDAQRAVRFVRSHAGEWNLDPGRIGILGFSAGGHLASSAATHYTPGDPQSPDPVERVSSRPDAQILIYPVVTMGPGGHGGSKNNLLGAKPDPALVELLSNEKQVTKDTPPAFLVHSTQDTAVPVSNSDTYGDALDEAGVPYEYVRGPLGGHGFGLKPFWTLRCLQWLHKLNFVRAEPTARDADPGAGPKIEHWPKRDPATKAATKPGEGK